jgi:hypothetical protein
MRKANKHVVIHSRVTRGQIEFIEAEAYEDNVLDDDEALRAPYHDPLPVRTSLMPRENGAVPVSHFTIDGGSVWYIYDGNDQIVYLEPGAFFRAGEGAREHIRFWNPVQKRICRAHFLGAERPPTKSPDPQPTNLEAAMSDLDLTSSSKPTVECVKPELKLDKNRAKPLFFSTQAGREIRTGWERWEARGRGTRCVFLYVDRRTANEYRAQHLPRKWVQPKC